MKLEELPCHSLREKALYLREKDQQKPGPLSEGAEKAVRRWRWASRGTVATLGLKKGLAGTLLEGGACQGRKQACGAGGASSRSLAREMASPTIVTLDLVSGTEATTKMTELMPSPGGPSGSRS